MVRQNSSGFMSLVVQYQPWARQGHQRSAVLETGGTGTGDQRMFSRQGCGSVVFYKLSKAA